MCIFLCVYLSIDFPGVLPLLRSTYKFIEIDELKFIVLSMAISVPNPGNVTPPAAFVLTTVFHVQMHSLT